MSSRSKATERWFSRSYVTQFSKGENLQRNRQIQNSHYKQLIESAILKSANEVSDKDKDTKLKRFKTLGTRTNELFPQPKLAQSQYPSNPLTRRGTVWQDRKVEPGHYLMRVHTPDEIANY
jgi:hypothetical protein